VRQRAAQVFSICEMMLQPLLQCQQSVVHAIWNARRT
jgi:hypothetical protein